MVNRLGTSHSLLLNYIYKLLITQCTMSRRYRKKKISDKKVTRNCQDDTKSFKELISYITLVILCIAPGKHFLKIDLQEILSFENIFLSNQRMVYQCVSSYVCIWIKVVIWRMTTHRLLEKNRPFCICPTSTELKDSEKRPVYERRYLILGVLSNT